MKGILNYSEYSCPCGGEIARRSGGTITKGWFRLRYIFVYYYECNMCGRCSEHFEADVTHKYK